jgi:hypothetical protein
MRELRILNIRLAIDWFEDRDPTPEELVDIIYAANEAMSDVDGQPAIGYDLIESLAFELSDDDEEVEL